MDKLTTGCMSLDRLLGGGFSPHRINFIYGEASTGKTILSVQSAVEAARHNHKVFYLDTDQSLSPHLLENLPVDPEAAQRIVVFRPDDFRAQVSIIESLESLLTKTPSLLVIDSMTGLYRANLRGHRDAFVNNRELNRQLAYLADMAGRLELATILTGEVHSQPGPVEWSVGPVAARTLEHWSQTILRLAMTPRREVRECTLEKLDGRNRGGSRVLFRITGNGIEDA
jgi:DNA repair protein RadB